MFQLSEKLSKSKDNYLVRKILLLISIILICITIASLICYLFHFYNRIDQEITFLKDVDPAKIHSTKEKIESDALINSHSYQLRNFLPYLILLNLSILAIGLLLSIFAITVLFLNKNNAEKFFIYLIFIQLFSFCIFFLSISVSEYQLKKVFDFGYLNGNEFAKYKYLPKMNIWYVYVSLFIALSNMIILIIAKTKYGYLKNDKLLQKKLIDTTKWEQQIIK